MPGVLSIVAPIFALIFVGWAARRASIMGPRATGELNRFVVYLALPALLFDIASHARWSEIWQPGFIVAYGLGALVVFAIAAALALRDARPLADAAILGLDAGYANTGYLGFPLAAAAFGPAALAPTMIATIITVCILFALAIILVEFGLRSGEPRVALVRNALVSVARNPLVFAPCLGALAPLAGLTVPDSAETFLKLLGGAASPCALVALGLFLAEKRERQTGDGPTTAVAVVLKLVAQPLVTWLLATYAFALPSAPAHAAVLVAALPTGTGPFMLAEFYGCEAGVTARVILISTLLSLASVSAYLYVIG